MKKVSFDFDGTLDIEIVQNYAKLLIDKGIEVHIVTTRWEDPTKYPFLCNHNDLFEIANKIGIKKENIHFNNMEYKYTFFLNNPNFIWHLDDNYEEKYEMDTNLPKNSVICILHKNGDYFEDICDEKLSNETSNK